MLEFIIKEINKIRKNKIRKNNMWNKLIHQFELEDLYKEILLYTDNGKDESLMIELLELRLNNRKNLYIYPAKDNV